MHSGSIRFVCSNQKPLLHRFDLKKGAIRRNKWSKYFVYSEHFNGAYKKAYVANTNKSISWVLEHKHQLRKEVVVIDDPLYFRPLLDYCVEEGIPVFAVVHNMESLVPGQTTGSDSLNLFSYELEGLVSCTGVITISREENLLLTNVGGNSYYLAYNPPSSIVDYLESIKGARESSSKLHFIMLGTMHNHPTRMGYAMLLNEIAENNPALAKEIIIAGFGADKLKEDLGQHRKLFDIRSDVSDNQLRELLVNTKALICYQQQAGGALTRIQEALLAGIPVIANPIAARSYIGEQGVQLFDTVKDLEEELEKIEEVTPQPQCSDAKGLQAFLKTNQQDD